MPQGRRGHRHRKSVVAVSVTAARRTALHRTSTSARTDPLTPSARTAPDGTGPVPVDGWRPVRSESTSTEFGSPPPATVRRGEAAAPPPSNGPDPRDDGPRRSPWRCSLEGGRATVEAPRLTTVTCRHGPLSWTGALDGVQVERADDRRTHRRWNPPPSALATLNWLVGISDPVPACMRPCHGSDSAPAVPGRSALRGAPSQPVFWVVAAGLRVARSSSSAESAYGRVS